MSPEVLISWGLWRAFLLTSLWAVPGCHEPAKERTQPRHSKPRADANGVPFAIVTRLRFEEGKLEWSSVKFGAPVVPICCLSHPNVSRTAVFPTIKAPLTRTPNPMAVVFSNPEKLPPMLFPPHASYSQGQGCPGQRPCRGTIMQNPVIFAACVLLAAIALLAIKNGYRLKAKILAVFEISLEPPGGKRKNR